MQPYSRLSIFFHWLIAVLIIGAFALGTVMTDMKISPTKLQYYSWHKWLGVSILALVAVRLLSRLLLGAPAYPDSMKKWEKQLANATHIFLYFLMFAVPLSGYFYTSAAGIPVVYFKLIELPTIIGPNPELKPILKELHEVLTTVLLIVVSLHVAAALKHYFIDKDGIFQRMLPGK
ncbi:MAG: cytochrome b [Pseudomonadota bacterium]